MLTVLNKADLLKPEGVADDAICVSARTGDGIDALLDAVAVLAGGSGRESSVITRARHRALVTECMAGCEAFLSGDVADADLRAEDLRRAVYALGRLTGRVDVEEVLGEIFGRFCIGK